MELNCIECNISFTRSLAKIQRGRVKFCSQKCYTLNKSKKSDLRTALIIKNNCKQCQMCKETKNLKLFHKSKHTKSGYSSYCASCKYKSNQTNSLKRLHKDREKYLRFRKNNHLKRKFKITIEEYETILEKQEHRCAICNKLENSKKKMNVDHDHMTNEIRGLLCHHCNIGLGNFKDNVENLNSAIKYLKTFTNVHK